MYIGVCWDLKRCMVTSYLYSRAIYCTETEMKLTLKHTTRKKRFHKNPKKMEFFVKRDNLFPWTVSLLWRVKCLYFEYLENLICPVKHNRFHKNPKKMEIFCQKRQFVPVNCEFIVTCQMFILQIPREFDLNFYMPVEARNFVIYICRTSQSNRPYQIT